MYRYLILLIVLAFSLTACTQAALEKNPKHPLEWRGSPKAKQIEQEAINNGTNDPGAPH